MAEVLSKRSRYQKVFDDPVGENTYRAEVHAGGVHFMGDDDQWHDMDGLLVNGETTAKDIKYGFVAGTAGIRKDGKYLGFEPKALLLLDTASGDTYEVEVATIGTPVITGNSLDLADVFTDTDLQVNFSEWVMAKWWNVATRPTLPDPVSLGMDPATTYLVWAYSKKITGGQLTFTDRAQAQEWDGSLLLGEVGVEDRNGTELYWFRQGEAVSDGDRRYQVHYVVPQGYDFGEAMRYSDVQIAHYPLIVDPSTTVYTGNEDGSIEDASTVDTSSASHRIGTYDDGKDSFYYRYYCRFDLSGIGSGDTCDTATLDLYSTAQAGSNWTITPKIYTTDWGPTLASGDHGQAGSTQTGIAQGSWSTSAYNSFDLTESDVEDWFGSANYCSFEVRGDIESGSVDEFAFIRSADYPSTSNDPKMSITYTEGGGATAKSASDTLLPTLVDAGSVFGSISSSDILLPNLSEGVPSILATLASSDTLLVTLTDAGDLGLIDKVASDTLLVAVADAVTDITAAVSASDTLTPSLSEGAVVILAQVSGSDTLLPVLDEVVSWDTVMEYSSSDIIVVTLAEGRYLDDGTPRLKRIKKMAKGIGIGIGLK